MNDHPPEFLEFEEVLEIHRMQLDEFGGAEGIRDRALLESALAQPFRVVFLDDARRLPVILGNDLRESFAAEPIESHVVGIRPGTQRRLGFTFARCGIDDRRLER